MTTRRAASLVELVVVMSACATLLTTSAVLMHRTMHANSKARTFLAVQRSSLRLSDQFRRDVHEAKASLEGDLPAEIVLRLQHGEMQTVEYRHAAGVVRRTVLAGEQIVSREEFTFPTGIELAVRHEDSPRRVILSITNDPSGPAESRSLQTFATPLSLQVEACLGRRSQGQAATLEKGATP